MEHDLLRETEGVVAPTVELLRGQTTEVADARERERQQAVQELPHAVTTEGDVGADRLALTQLELRDGLGGLADLRLLTGDQGQVGDRAVDQLGITGSVTGIRKNMLSLHGESRTASKVNLFAFAGRGRVTYPGDDCKTPEKKS